MALVSLPAQPSDGTTADAADVNDQVNAIVAQVNGNLDSDNLAANSVGTSELQNGSVTQVKLNANTLTGWNDLLDSGGNVDPPNTITANGNRSYTLVFNGEDYTSKLSEGMRMKFTRSVTAPTQSTSLNGSTQYWSKSSPNKLTFTDDFVCSAWIYLTSYQAATVVGRQDATPANGFEMQIDSTGRVALIGRNGGAGNYSLVQSVQSVPLNRWVHVAAQLDMSSFTATTTTSYIMIDGLDAPATVSRSGTNPTALVQAGDLAVGRGGSFASQYFPGKIAQVAIYNAKVTQSTILASISQGLAGTETSLASAYSFNGVATDLNTTTPNDLSAAASAGYTSDGPFAGGNRSYDTAGTTEHAMIMAKPSFSTNTTVTVQVPEGHALPTSGGISASAYSTQQAPYGFPRDKGRWEITSFLKGSLSSNTPTASTWYSPGSSNWGIKIPTGSWLAGYSISARCHATGSVFLSQRVTLSTTNNSETITNATAGSSKDDASSGVITLSTQHTIEDFALSVASLTQYYALHYVIVQVTMGTTNGFNNLAVSVIKATPAYI